MPAVVLYREGVTLGERWARCGFGLPLKSLRASWQRVQVDVDHLEFSVRTATRHVVMMPPGRHEDPCAREGVRAIGGYRRLDRRPTGYRRHNTSVPGVGQPVHTTWPAPGTRGQRRLSSFSPYRFYKSWPLFITALGSSTVAGLGAAAVAAAVYVLTQHVLAGLLLLACVSVVVPTLLFSGIGGLVMAARFLRLSSDWRAPRKAGAPVAPGPLHTVT